MRHPRHRFICLVTALALLLFALSGLPAAAQGSRQTVITIATDQIVYTIGETVEVEIHIDNQARRAVTGELTVELQLAPLDSPTLLPVAAPPPRTIRVRTRSELVERYVFTPAEYGSSGLFRVAATLDNQTVYAVFNVEGGLALAFEAPEQVEPDEEFVVALQVSNLLDMPIRAVEVDVAFPPGSAQPTAHLSIARLAPGAARREQWTVQSGASGPALLTAIATSDNGGNAKVSFLLSIVGAPEVIAELASAETQVGARFVLTGTLYNVGGRDVTEVTAELVLPDGLTMTDAAAVAARGIPAGEQAQVAWTLTARAPGRYAVELQAEYGGPQSASAVGFVTAADGDQGAEDGDGGAPGPEERQEPWTTEWEVVKTAEPDLGFHLDAERIGAANPPPGRRGIRYLHPVSTSEPAQLRRKVELAGATPLLKMGVAGNADPAGDWALDVRVAGEPLGESRVIAGTTGWQDLTFDLGPYAGETVLIEIDVRANNWYYEHAYFDYIQLTSTPERDTDAGETGPIGAIFLARAVLDAYRSAAEIEITTYDEGGSESLQYLTITSEFVRTSGPYGYDEYIRADFPAQGGAEDMFFETYWVGDQVALAIDGEWQTLSREDSEVFHPQKDFVETYLEQVLANPDNLAPQAIAQVNDLATRHFTLTGPVEGDAWIALDGAYVVRAEFAVDMEDVPASDSAGAPILVRETLTVSTDVYDVNRDLEILWPEDAPGLNTLALPRFAPGEFPMPPGSRLISALPDMYEFSVPLGEAEVLTFYEQALGALGWEGMGDIGYVTWCKGEFCFIMYTWTNEAGDTTVTVFVGE